MLVVSRLQATRDDRTLFEELSFSLNPGDIIQLAGPNGAGKTTLLNCIVGLTRPDAGNIQWQDDHSGRFRQPFSYIGHQLGLKLLLTPLENLDWLGRLRGLVYQRAEVMQALVKVGLSGYEDVPVGRLSAGQKRRVALARLFVENARVWVLDEPFTAIDQNGVQRLEGWLTTHAGKGGMVLLTTHHRFPAEFPVRALALDAFAPAESR